MPRKKAKTWERVSFTIDAESLTRAERIKHMDISYSNKKQRETEIAHAAAVVLPHVGPLTIDHETSTVFKYTADNRLLTAATFAVSAIEDPKPEEELADLFAGAGEAA